jgi:type IV pilus assembly protein PilV
MTRCCATRRAGLRQKGFSMLEVLVSILVLAIGLLGFALLQTVIVRMSQSANYRTNATNLATELLDQMRVNRIDAGQYATNATFTANTVANAACIPTVAAEVSVAQTCAQWKCQVVRALGAGASANVTYRNSVATVTLAWGERSGSNVNTQFAVSSRL